MSAQHDLIRRPIWVFISRIANISLSLKKWNLKSAVKKYFSLNKNYDAQFELLSCLSQGCFSFLEKFSLNQDGENSRRQIWESSCMSQAPCFQWFWSKSLIWPVLQFRLCVFSFLSFPYIGSRNPPADELASAVWMGVWWSGENCQRLNRAGCVKGRNAVTLLESSVFQGRHTAQRLGASETFS